MKVLPKMTYKLFIHVKYKAIYNIWLKMSNSFTALSSFTLLYEF